MADFVSEVNYIPEEHEIYQNFKKSKKTCSVPGDLPLKVLNEFLPEFVKLMTNIFSQCVILGIYPTNWKIYIS